MYILHDSYPHIFAVSAAFHLVIWEEGTVRVHSNSELKNSLPDNRASADFAGEMCEIKFGRTYYTGKIACSGKFHIEYNACTPMQVATYNEMNGFLV